MFQLLFNDSNWRRSPDTNRFAVEWSHRGDVRDVLDGSLWTVLGAGMDLQVFHHQILRYWTGTPNQHRQTNRLYRRMRIGAAQGDFLRATTSDSWSPVTAAFLAQNGLAAAALRCFPTTPTFGTRATTVCGGLRRSARTRLRMGYVWCAFWITRDRSSFLLLRCATRLRRELYGVLGAYKYT